MMQKIFKFKFIILIFLIALGVRFLYFPNNIYFGFDQARDAYEAQKIVKGDLLLIGPSTLLEGLNHGVLYYYIYAPIYLIAQGDPTGIAILHRIANAFGVVLIFYLTQKLFNKKAAFIAAIIFAFSFEQTQFALYLNHPSFGILSILLMYLGFVLAIFDKKKLGLLLSFLGLGLSIQFEFVLTYLIFVFLAILILFRKSFLKFNLKFWGLSFLILILSLLSFILVEVRFNFKSIKPLLSMVEPKPEKVSNDLINNLFYTAGNLNGLNITAAYPFDSEIVRNLNNFSLILLLFIFILSFIKYKEDRNKLKILGLWYFLSLLLIHLMGGGKPLQYHNVGISLSLIIFVSFILNKLLENPRFKYLSFLLLGLILIGNIHLITKFNPWGTIPEIHVQQKMLLSDQKKILDLIYEDAKGDMFAAKALTMPFMINTTWSYLYQWYGKQKYGYEPIWGDKNASGYEGGLKVNDAQHSLPKVRYLVIEPLRGIYPHIINDYLRIEGYFTDVVWEKEVGEFKVQKRILKD